MYKIVVGEISGKRRENWFCGEDDPYGVWEGEALAEAACNAGTWRTADELLRDHTDIDWGSIAWRGTGGGNYPVLPQLQTKSVRTEAIIRRTRIRGCVY